MPGHPPTTSSHEGEEELRTGTGRRPSRRVLLVVAAVLALAAGGAIVAAVRSGTPHRVATPASRTVARPGPSASTARPPAGCPAGATCSTATDLPLTTADAVRNVLPNAVILSSTSLLANRVGHFEPDLVSRRIDVLSGVTRVTLLVAPAPSGTAPDRTRLIDAVGTRRGADGRGQVDGYAVTGELTTGRTPVGRGARAAEVRALSRLVTSPALTDAQ